MIVEVVAIGTELLLGPSVDTNSTWIGERLAESGFASYFHTVVGDNRARMVQALRVALDRSDAVIVTGGLGPTQDDITREAIAEVMGVELEFDRDSEAILRALFEARKREMPESNLRQAYRPVGASAIPQRRGTAPGLICPIGERVVYALPGVPYEMQEMMERAVLPDLRARGGEGGAIVSRFLRTWGESEARLSEIVAPRLEALETSGHTTLAFLAHGVEGIHLRITARAGNRDAAVALLDDEEAELRTLLGPLVFGIDEQTMEAAVAALLTAQGLTLGIAESLTGGMVASRLTAAPGASAWFRGGIVSYATEVKRRLLSVPDGPVVSARAAAAMADGARRMLDTDVAISLTGVAGPGMQDGEAVGTVFAGIALGDAEPEVVRFHLPGDRQRIRELSCINALDALRRRLLSR